MPTDKLHVHLFGSPLFTDQGKPITGFVSNKTRTRLIYLAVTRPTTAARLLWADHTSGLIVATSIFIPHQS